MRYSRMKEQPPEEPRHARGGGVILVLILAAAAVYLLCTAKTGSFLSEKVIAPVSRFFAEKGEGVSAAEAPAPPKEEGVSEKVHFGEIELSVLQTGVYESVENAEKAADDLQKIGGAGYILEENSKYRVLISGYAEENDAENVKERLKKEQNIETKLLKITQPEQEYTVTTEPDAAEFFHELANFAPELHKTLMDYSLSLDRGDLSPEEAREKIAALSGSVAEFSEKLSFYSTKNDDPFLRKLTDYADGCREELSLITGDLSAVGLSAQVKHAYLGCACQYRDLLMIDD